MLGHIVGLPVEESVMQLAPAGAAAATAAAIVGQAWLRRLLKRLGH